MLKSTLLSTLSQFSQKEIKEFGEYINTPFFNKNENVRKLYNYIKKFYPDLSNPKLEKETAYKKLFGKDEYNDGFMRGIIFNLVRLSEEYLSYLNFKRNEKWNMLHLLTELMDRGNWKLLESNIKEADKLEDNKIYDDPDSYYFKFNTEFMKNYLFSLDFSVKKDSSPDEKMYKEPEYLITFFLLRILANHFYHLNQSMIINYKPKLLFLDEIILFIKNNPEYLQNPLVSISYHRVILLRELTDDHYHTLKKVFTDEVANLSSFDKYNTLSILINYCQKAQAETGDIKYAVEKFDVLKFSVQQKIFSFRNDEPFSEGKFKNIVQTGAELGEFDWTEKFINDHKSLLSSDVSADVVSYSLAYLLFEKKDYEGALKHLNIVQVLKDASTKMNLKVLYLMIFYELNWKEQAFSLADSFRHVIQNDKLLPEAQKESNKNFCSLYSKLLGLKTKDNLKGLDEFKDQVNGTSPLVQKQWLLEKADEFTEF